METASVTDRARPDAGLDDNLTLAMPDPSHWRACGNDLPGLLYVAVRLTTTSHARIVALGGSATA